MTTRLGPEDIERRVAILTRLAESRLSVREVAAEWASQVARSFRGDANFVRSADPISVRSEMRFGGRSPRRSTRPSVAVVHRLRARRNGAGEDRRQAAPRGLPAPVGVASAPTVNVADRTVVSMSPVNTGHELDVAEDGEIEAIVAASEPGGESWA